jgi:hypothetical protein
VYPRHLLLGGLAALVVAVGLAIPSIGPEPERAVGVTRGASGVEIRYLLCDDERLHFVRLLDYGRGYGSGYVGPVVWQLHSDRGAHIERVTVGRVPAGFEEEVNRLPLPSPSKLTVVTDPYGEDAMSFHLGDLRRGRVYRADYAYLSLRGFNATKRAYCGERRRAHRFRLASYPFFGAAAAALAGAFARRVRRQRLRRVS